mmetsp:Transcript_21800/g.34981  ORF Transcript_21800/g.34981 Transcript_21800/m.34981 type:complete len:81 (-) Transcript_21800:4-246(-)
MVSSTDYFFCKNFDCLFVLMPRQYCAFWSRCIVLGCIQQKVFMKEYILVLESFHWNKTSIHKKMILNNFSHGNLYRCCPI